jgi:hypothetical protein
MDHSFFKCVDFDSLKSLKVEPPIVPLQKFDSEFSSGGNYPPVLVENIMQRDESSDGVNIEFTNFTFTGHKDSRRGEDALCSPH